jgi:epoxyqueuosine reductase
MSINLEQLEQVIRETYESLERNNFSTLGRPDHVMWDAPFFGVSSGDDPLYDFLKKHIGAFHWHPLEAFRMKYDDVSDASRLRVISICFPQTMESKASQAKEILCPSREWIVTRGEWEPLVREFSEKITETLQNTGVRCVSIELLPGLMVHKDGHYGLSSTWSHRHAAYISGLGTFGLSDGLITKKGKAVRFTTLILEAPLEIQERPYKDHQEWCLYYKDGSCGACMGRCPINAITEAGHDKNACADYEDVFSTKYWPQDIERGDYILGCGLCQAGIPCQNQNPTK